MIRENKYMYEEINFYCLDTITYEIKCPKEQKHNTWKIRQLRLLALVTRQSFFSSYKAGSLFFLCASSLATKLDNLSPQNSEVPALKRNTFKTTGTTTLFFLSWGSLIPFNVLEEEMVQGVNKQTKNVTNLTLSSPKRSVAWQSCGEAFYEAVNEVIVIKHATNGKKWPTVLQKKISRQSGSSKIELHNLFYEQTTINFVFLGIKT